MSLPPLFLINGAPAAGKTSFSLALMRRFEKGLHIPVDDLREWVVSGIAHPMNWTDETARQFRLAEEAAADLAISYRRAGFAVAFDHCRIPENIEWLTDARLGGPPVYRIMLVSDVETHLERNSARVNKDFDPVVLEPIITGLVPQLAENAKDRAGWIFFDNRQDGIEDAVTRLLETVGLG